MSAIGAAPTRSGRLTLTRRIELARHAAELLHSKEEALERERVRLEGHAARAAERWAERWVRAEGWLERARALGASDELHDLVTLGPDPADVTPGWQMSMGVEYPGEVEVEAGAPPEVTSTAALRPAIEAYREALRAAAVHAATSTAVHRLEAELAATRRRRRAIEERLQPRLEESLRVLDLHLDELDREEALRIHSATTSSPTPEGGRPC